MFSAEYHNIKLILGLIICALFIIPNVLGQAVFSSEYSDFSDEFCVGFDSPEPGSDGWEECKGKGNYKIHIYYDHYGDRIAHVLDIDGEFMTDLVASDCGMRQNYGEKLEWRFADGEPFACIIRVHCFDQEEKEKGELEFYNLNEYLLVRGLQGYVYINTDVDVKKNPNANEVARSIADKGYKRKNK
ncbi:MAG: hypothetical protein IH946_04745 [Bacteroidetes bacterium]|nr:hypothetical protein [Bacteroidota bacterium]